MYLWRYRLRGEDMVKGVVRNFLVHASSGCWSLSYCLQGGTRPIQKFVFVLVLGCNCHWECHILNGVL